MYMKTVSDLYHEEPNVGNIYREQYLNGLDALIQRKQREAVKNRDDVGRQILLQPELYREWYRSMLGWPLTESALPILNVQEKPVFENEEAQITRIQLEVFENLPFYGILFTHKSETPLPLVLSQHGGLGTPEICSSFFDSANYNDMSMRLFRQGVNVFAPQLLLWNPESFGPDHKRGDHDVQLKQLGGSIAAFEIYCLERAIDYLQTRPECSGVFGMAGLSYGGFYTLYTAAAETRIQAALSCGFFNDRIRFNWADWVWNNAAHTFLDAEVGALVYPRPLWIAVGDEDPLFDVASAKEEQKRLAGYYANYPDRLHFEAFKGVHEFCVSDDGIRWLCDYLKSK